MRVVLVGVVAGGAALLALGGTLAARTAAPKRVGVALIVVGCLVVGVAR